MRLIDADKMRDNAIRMGFHSTTMTISEFINLQPSVDVRPNIRGEWIYNAPPDNYHAGLVTCNKCGHEEIGSPNDFNYCSNCGADMRSKDVC